MGSSQIPMAILRAFGQILLKSAKKGSPKMVLFRFLGPEGPKSGPDRPKITKITKMAKMAIFGVSEIDENPRPAN